MAKTAASDIDRWLDDLDPTTIEWRDAQHFRRIVRAREHLEAAERELRDAVAAARKAGDSWTVIGAALGVTRQSAWERFGRTAKLQRQSETGQSPD